MEPGEHLDRVFDGVALVDATLRGASFERCTFRRCRIEASRLADCRFTDCTFEHSELINVRLPDCSLVDVVFRGGRAMGVDFSGVRQLVLGMSFDDVAMDYANFTGLPLKKTVFSMCRLREATFSQCDLSGASFSGCDLTGAVIRHAKLVQTDFEGAVGVALDGSTCQLRFTRVDGDTARILLRDLGVICADLGVA